MSETRGTPIQIESVATPGKVLLLREARVDAYGRKVPPGVVSLWIGNDGHRPAAIYVTLDDLESAVALLASEMRGKSEPTPAPTDREAHEAWRESLVETVRDALIDVWNPQDDEGRDFMADASRVAVGALLCYHPDLAARPAPVVSGEVALDDPRVAELEAEVARLRAEARTEFDIATGYMNERDAARAELAALREGIERYVAVLASADPSTLAYRSRVAADLRALLAATPSERAAADEHGETGAGS